MRQRVSGYTYLPSRSGGHDKSRGTQARCRNVWCRGVSGASLECSTQGDTGRASRMAEDRPGHESRILHGGDHRVSASDASWHSTLWKQRCSPSYLSGPSLVPGREQWRIQACSRPSWDATMISGQNRLLHWDPGETDKTVSQRLDSMESSVT